jgi:hypothetical protein
MPFAVELLVTTTDLALRADSGNVAATTRRPENAVNDLTAALYNDHSDNCRKQAIALKIPGSQPWYCSDDRESKRFHDGGYCNRITELSLPQLET